MKIKTNNLYGAEVEIKAKEPVLGNYRNPKRSQTILKDGNPILETESNLQKHKKAMRKRHPTEEKENGEEKED